MPQIYLHYILQVIILFTQNEQTVQPHPNPPLSPQQLPLQATLLLPQVLTFRGKNIHLQGSLLRQ